MGVNNKASPPGRHQEQAPKQRCTFSPTTFSSVQFSACGRTTGHPYIARQLCMPPKRSATFWVVVTSPSACCQHPSNCTMPHNLYGPKCNFLDADQTMSRACRCGIACGSALGIVVRTDPSACIACALHSGAFPHT